jgi:hypothetical protein
VLENLRNTVILGRVMETRTLKTGWRDTRQEGSLLRLSSRVRNFQSIFIRRVTAGEVARVGMTNSTTDGWSGVPPT